VARVQCKLKCDALRAALERYGRHDITCSGTRLMRNDLSCNCGLSRALHPERRETA
jgi:hypothetical protein